MELLQTLCGFFVVLIILVGVHEFGHFYVARLCGVRVLRFCIGMGKPLFSWRDRKGTEFALAPIPLGGYVKMLDDTEEPVPHDQRSLAFNHKNVWQRIAILAAGPIANLILAIVVFGILGMGGIASLSPHIGKVEPNSIAASAGMEKGQEIRAIDGVETLTREAVYEQLLLRLGETGSLVISVKYPDDSNLTYDLTLNLDGWMQDEVDPDPLKGLGFSFYRPAVLPVIAKVVSGSAAERAGLQVGDTLNTIEGLPVTSWEQWVDYIQARPGQPLLVELTRDGQRQQVSLTPDSHTENGKTIGRIGVYPTAEDWPEEMKRERSVNFWQAWGYGVEQSYKTAAMVMVSIKKLLVGEISTKNLSGPIGIAKVAGDSARAGAAFYFGFLAQLSVYLAVLNLLPIPVLDGGHILYCLVEAVKGSPVSEKLKIFSAQLGIILLGGVMIIAFYNDILRL